MQIELYADGIGEITVSGSIVRIDFVSLSATERDSANNPKSVFRQRVIMPIDAFANSVELMQKALAGLVDAGALTRNPSVVSTLHPASSDNAAMPRPNGSPNFR
jgi:hypothetical protein